jgi:hypothetical protein
MKKIIYTQADGSVAVVHPVINTHPVRENLTEDEALGRAMLKLPPDAIDPQIIDEADIPADRSFRNAWSRMGSKIVHDMGRARDIHRDRLRAARAPLLAELDVAYQRADEKSDAAEKARVVVQKQVLRDITKHPDIDSAKTIDDLKAVSLGRHG